MILCRTVLPKSKNLDLSIPLFFSITRLALALMLSGLEVVAEARDLRVLFVI
jgi:hypothetical protein